MDDTSARIAVKRAIVDRLRAALGSDVSVFAGWPGDELTDEMMFPTEISGTLELPVMMADRHYRDDVFTITWAFRAARSAQTYDGAEDRIAYIAAALDNSLADNTTLGEDSTIESSMTDWRHTCASGQEGIAAYGEATTTHHCRYH